MSYSELANFIEFYTEDEAAELCNLDNPLMSAERQRILDAIAYADSEINSIVGERYGFPINPTPPYLKWASIVIARKNLHTYEETEKVRKDYEDIIKQLQKIASGDAILIGADLNPVPPKHNIEDDSAEDYRGQTYSSNRNLYTYTPMFGGLNAQLYYWNTEQDRPYKPVILPPILGSNRVRRYPPNMNPPYYPPYYPTYPINQP